jgi:hypothetical protein
MRKYEKKRKMDGEVWDGLLFQVAYWVCVECIDTGLRAVVAPCQGCAEWAGHDGVAKDNNIIHPSITRQATAFLCFGYYPLRPTRPTLCFLPPRSPISSDFPPVHHLRVETRTRLLYIVKIGPLGYLIAATLHYLARRADPCSFRNL